MGNTMQTEDCLEKCALAISLVHGDLGVFKPIYVAEKLNEDLFVEALCTAFHLEKTDLIQKVIQLEKQMNDELEI